MIEGRCNRNSLTYSLTHDSLLRVHSQISMLQRISGNETETHSSKFSLRLRSAKCVCMVAKSKLGVASDFFAFLI